MLVGAPACMEAAEAAARVVFSQGIAQLGSRPATAVEQT
jgi:hypothetical protein